MRFSAALKVFRFSSLLFCVQQMDLKITGNSQVLSFLLAKPLSPFGPTCLHNFLTIGTSGENSFMETEKFHGNLMYFYLMVEAFIMDII